MRKISDTSVEPSIGNFGNFGKFKCIRIRLRFIAIAAFRPPPQIDRRLPSPCAAPLLTSGAVPRCACAWRRLCAPPGSSPPPPPPPRRRSPSPRHPSPPHSPLLRRRVRVPLPAAASAFAAAAARSASLRLASPSRLPARPRCTAWIFTAAASSSAFRAFISATDLRLTAPAARGLHLDRRRLRLRRLARVFVFVVASRRRLFRLRRAAPATAPRAVRRLDLRRRLRLRGRAWERLRGRGEVALSRTTLRASRPRCAA